MVILIFYWVLLSWLGSLVCDLPARVRSMASMLVSHPGTVVPFNNFQLMSGSHVWSHKGIVTRPSPTESFGDLKMDAVS